MLAALNRDLRLTASFTVPGLMFAGQIHHAVVRLADKFDCLHDNLRLNEGHSSLCCVDTVFPVKQFLHNLIGKAAGF